MKPIKCQLRLKLIRISFDYQIEIIERSLTPLGEAISQCIQTIKEAEETNDEDYIDYISNEEIWMVENLLGASFVLCQSYITLVISRIMALHRSCNLLTTDDSKADISKADIMKLGSPLLLQTGYSQVQIIDAFANYFKHHEEWDKPWEQLPGRSARTVQILFAVGASQFSTGNFRIAAKKLGNYSYDNLQVFSRILQDWSQAVYERYNLELQVNGLL